MLNDKFGNIAFWFLFIGFNLTFFPMHWLGLNGMPRRIYSYASDQGWDQLNLLCTIGAFTMAVAVITLFVDMFFLSARNGRPAGNDPWDARTLEWTISSPPPAHNFDEVPVVKSLDDFWTTKHPELLHTEGEPGHEVADHPVAHGAGHGHHDDHGIHMPGGSWFPLLASVGFAIGAYGLVQMGGWAHITDPAKAKAVGQFMYVAIAGGVLGTLGVYCWSLEPIGGYYIHLKKEGDHE